MYTAINKPNKRKLNKTFIESNNGLTSNNQLEKQADLFGKKIASESKNIKYIKNNIIDNKLILDKRLHKIIDNYLPTDLSKIEVYNDAESKFITSKNNTKALTYGNSIFLNFNSVDINTVDAIDVIAHEIAHVNQQQRMQKNMIQRYRDPSSFNFQEKDLLVFIKNKNGIKTKKSIQEDSFDISKDKETKSWIEHISVVFNNTFNDSEYPGIKVSEGVATIKFYKDSISTSKFKVTGGSKEVGKTDAGEFTVHRIEGNGYNSGKYSGKVDLKEREGPMNRYSKKGIGSNMSYAVFYNKGEALHEGPIDSTSHGCIHVNWNTHNMQFINFFSVINLTKVSVKYT